MLKFDHISKNALDYIGSKTPELIIKDNVKMKHRFKKMFVNIFCIQGKYSKVDDDIINDLLKHGRITCVDHYAIHIEYNSDAYDIWIGNYPYSYGYIFRINGIVISEDTKRRVSYKTLIKLNLLIQIILDIIVNEESKRTIEILNKYYKKDTD